MHADRQWTSADDRRIRYHLQSVLPAIGLEPPRASDVGASLKPACEDCQHCEQRQAVTAQRPPHSYAHTRTRIPTDTSACGRTCITTKKRFSQTDKAPYIAAPRCMSRAGHLPDPHTPIRQCNDDICDDNLATMAALPRRRRSSACPVNGKTKREIEGTSHENIFAHARRPPAPSPT